MTDAWGWPQYVLIALTGWSVFYNVVNHGKPDTPHNAYAACIGAAVTAWLLHMGGFW